MLNYITWLENRLDKSENNLDNTKTIFYCERRINTMGDYFISYFIECIYGSVFYNDIVFISERITKEFIKVYEQELFKNFKSENPETTCYYARITCISKI
jgi:hypothetical protein